MRRNLRSEIFSTILLLLVTSFSQSCGSAGSLNNANTTGNSEAQTETATEEPLTPVDPTILDRLRTEKWSGDLDGLVQRRYIRALVLYNKTSFFFDGPQPRGISYEGLKEFERFLNKKLNAGDKPVHVVFLPVTREEALKRMSDGRGDIAVANIPIVPEMQAIADFSDPVRDNARELVVTGPTAPPISTLEDLSGKEIFVRRNSRYWPNIEKLNEQFKQTGKPLAITKEADGNLEDEDILNMVATGQAGITVMDDLVASTWSNVFKELNVHSDLSIKDGDQIGWAVQKGTPKFVALINEFVKDHKVGTSFGNTVLLRYLKDTKFAANNTAPTEMEKYRMAWGFIRKYAAEYNFDPLMIAAQAYQESTIDQSKSSPAGAFGVMQIKPSTAEGNPINIKEIKTNMEHNINAGVKYMDYIISTNFKDAKFDKVNRALFGFAAYNAGPARVASLRKKAEAEGLNPNIWFNNVEIIAAREIGPETVTYVSNIYKYYIGYRMFAERMAAKKGQ